MLSPIPLKVLTSAFLALALCFACLWGLDSRPWSTGWASPSMMEMVVTTYSGYACLLCASLSIAGFTLYSNKLTPTRNR